RLAVLARRDRFILRIPSPSTTIGGGEVVDTQPRYHRRFQPAILNRLTTLAQGAPEELVLAALDRRSRPVGAARSASSFIAPSPTIPKSTTHSSDKARSAASKFNIPKGLIGYELAEIVKQSNLSHDVTQQTLETLLTERRVRKAGALWFAQSVWDALVEE